MIVSRLLLAISLLLCGCSPRPASTPEHLSAVSAAAPPGARYSDPQRRFSIEIPADTTVRHDFKRSYLATGAWKLFADQDSHGAPVVALVLNGSNKITAAELRIGIGTDQAALAHCLDVPPSGVPAKADAVTLAGTRFTHFHASDAAMSHYLQAESYRAIHAGQCYAIDLLISGTRPEVYDPPATPPFDQAAAWRKLHHALDGFQWHS